MSAFGPDRVKTHLVVSSWMLGCFGDAQRPYGRWACRSESFNCFGQVWLRDAVRRAQRAANGVSGLHRSYQRIIAQQVQHLFEVVGGHMQAHFRTHPLERSGEEMGGAIQAFSVRNGCSTIWLRISIISGA